MKLSLFDYRMWIASRRKWLESHPLSPSEFAAVSKKAGYLAFLSAMDSGLCNKSKKLLKGNVPLAYDFVNECRLRAVEMQAKKRGDVFFWFGWAMAIDDFVDTFLEDED